MSIYIDNHKHGRAVNTVTWGASRVYMIIVGVLSLLQLIVHYSDGYWGFYCLSYLMSLIPLGIFNKSLAIQTGNTESQSSWCRHAIWVALVISALMTSISDMVSFQWLSIHKIHQLDFLAISCLILFLLAIWSVHVMLYQSHSKIRYAGRKRKLAFYGIIGSLVLLSQLSDWRHTVFLAAVLVIYFLLEDLFVEQKRPKLMWLIVWTVILGSFLAFLIIRASSTFLAATDIPFVNALSLFSILFILSGVLYVPLILLNNRLHFLPDEWQLNFDNHSQLRFRIQFSILATLVLSFVTIAIVSSYHLNTILPDFAAQVEKKFYLILLNTYVILFLIAFVISITLSEYIRTPLIELGRKIKDVKLTKDNHKIEWNGNDEIAQLIAEYNEMIDKLQENASVMAQIERDSAWQEMAKQVAHEIKNPLTPMQLSLQHLERSIVNKRDNIEELTIKMCHTLMNQVENLKEIANAFSNFGSLPRTNNEKIVLNNIMETIHDLFRKREDMDIKLIEPIDDVSVYADKNHLVRILNNLVKNAIEAIPQDRKGTIELKLWKENNRALIRVKDNGSGIPPEMQKNIFKPKFTTKTSGSGLGLAIAANMVESMGGRIYFQSENEKGTQFFVELPLARHRYDDTTTRVML